MGEPLGRCSHKAVSWGRRLSDCHRPAKVERNGQPYCGIHDPERLAAITKKADDARTARWEARKRWEDAKYAERMAQERKAAAYDTLHASLTEAREALRELLESSQAFVWDLENRIPDKSADQSKEDAYWNAFIAARTLLDANAREVSK